MLLTSGSRSFRHEAARFHHPAVGAVPSGAHRRACGRPAGRGPFGVGSACLRRGHHLSPDPARLPARAGCVSRRARGRRRAAAADRADRRHRRGRTGIRRDATGAARAMPSTCRRRSAAWNGASCWPSSSCLGGATGTASRRNAARRTPPERRARARRRSCTAPGRHDHPRGAVGAPRHVVPDHLDEYWQLTLVPADRTRVVARHPVRARRDRAGGAARSPDRRRGAPPCRVPRCAGHRGGLDRLDAGDRALLATIAVHPRGAVVLPGLDTSLDEAAWSVIGGGTGPMAGPSGRRASAIRHARAAGAHRHRAGARWPPSVPPASHGREVLLSEALRPAAATDCWRSSLAAANAGGALDRAMDTVTVIEAANVEEEALAIAVVLREALTMPGRSAALVTPDRALARRGGVSCASRRTRRSSRDRKSRPPRRRRSAPESRSRARRNIPGGISGSGSGAAYRGKRRYR